MTLQVHNAAVGYCGSAETASVTSLGHSWEVISSFQNIRTRKLLKPTILISFPMSSCSSDNWLFPIGQGLALPSLSRICSTGKEKKKKHRTTLAVRGLLEKYQKNIKMIKKYSDKSLALLSMGTKCDFSKLPVGFRHLTTPEKLKRTKRFHCWHSQRSQLLSLFSAYYACTKSANNHVISVTLWIMKKFTL